MANTNTNPNDQGVSFDEIIKSIQGKDVRKALEKDRKPVSSDMKKETVEKKVQEVIQEPVQKEEPQKNPVKRKKVKRKSTQVKTNLTVRKDILRIIRFKYNTPANQFVEKILIDIIIKKFPEYKDELLKS